MMLYSKIWKPKQIKIWSIYEKVNYPWEGKSIDDFFTNEANVIDEKYIMLDDAFPSSLIKSNVNPRWTQWKNEELGYVLQLATFRG